MTARGREAWAPSPANVPALLAELRAVAAESAAIEPGDGEPAVADAMRGLVVRARAVLHELQALDGDEAAPAGDDDWLGLRSGATSPVGDLCFAGTLELVRVHKELTMARSADDVLAAVEAARRKLRRAIHAVLDAAREAGPEPAAGEIESALAVRRLYTELRRSLRRPEGGDADAVLAALRYAAFALATLVAAPAYAAVRAPDRFVVRTLHRRCLDWARHDRSPDEGLRILEDVWISADLLRAINRRQELRVHDAAAVRTLLAGPRGDTREWFAQLERLFGIDDPLDDLIVRARGNALPDGLVPDALIRLAQIT